MRLIGRILASLWLWCFLVPNTFAVDIGPSFKRVDIKDICEAFIANERYLNSPSVARDLLTDQVWQPCSQVKLARGYTDDRIWIRFDLSNSSAIATILYVNLFPSWVTEINQYVFSEGELIRARNDGIAYPYVHREIPSANFVLPIKLAPYQKVTVLLHVTNDQSHFIGGSLLAEESALKSGVNVNLINGLLIGSIVVIGLYNLFIFFSIRDVNYLYYFLYNASMLFMLAIVYGFGYQYFWPTSILMNTFMASAAGPVLGICMALFVRQFLNLPQVSTTIDRIIKILIVGSVLVLLISLFPAAQKTTSAWSAILAIVGAPLIIVAGVKAFIKGQASAGYFLVAWIVSLISITFFGLMLGGILEFSLGLFYSFGIGAVLEMLLLSFALANKIHFLQIDKAQAIDAMLQAEKEYSKRIELAATQLEQKVSVRTRDLAFEKKRAELLARTDPLTGLNNRRAFFEKGEQLFEAARLSAGEKLFSVIMIDIDHFKKVNDNYGHSVGDLVITAVALKLLPSFKGKYVVGRIGGEEFAVAIQHTEFEEVIAQAEFARQCIGQTLTEVAKGEDVTVTISIGVAQYRDSDQSIDETLARADMALYQAKEQGRDRVISVL